MLDRAPQTQLAPTPRPLSLSLHLDAQVASTILAGSGLTLEEAARRALSMPPQPPAAGATTMPHVGGRAPKIPFEEARTFARALKLQSSTQWDAYRLGYRRDLPALPPNMPASPREYYRKSGWAGWLDFLGICECVTYTVYRPFEDARAFVGQLHLRFSNDWTRYCRGHMPHLPPLPNDIPANPHISRQYTNQWQGWDYWLDPLLAGRKESSGKHHGFLPFDEAVRFVHGLKLASPIDWRLYVCGLLKGVPRRPADIPTAPEKVYAEDWKGWEHWFGSTYAPKRIARTLSVPVVSGK